MKWNNKMEPSFNNQEYKNILAFHSSISTSTTDNRNIIQKTLDSIWGYEKTVFWTSDKDGNLSNPQLFGLKDTIIHEYIDNFEQLDFLHPKQHRSFLNKKITFTIENTMNMENLRENDYYNEFMKKNNYQDQMVVNFMYDNKLIATLGFLNPNKERTFNQTDVNRFQVLGKIISQKLIHERHYEDLLAKQKAFQLLMDKSKAGYILIDESKKMIYNNDTASSIIEDLLSYINSRSKKDLINFILMNAANLNGSMNFISTKKHTYNVSFIQNDHNYINTNTNFQLLIKLELENISIKNKIKFLPNFQCLTPRELEVSKLVIKGYPNQNIGKELFISINTVKRHVRNIFKKMSVNNRVSLINEYYRGINILTYEKI